MWPTFYIPRRRGRYPGRSVTYVYLTSMPYPIEVTESMQTAAALTVGYLFGTQYEDMDVVASIAAGELTVVLRTYDWTYEGIDTIASIPAGTLTVVLITYSNWEPEGVDVVAAVVAGTLT